MHVASDDKSEEVTGTREVAQVSNLRYYRISDRAQSGRRQSMQRKEKSDHIGEKTVSRRQCIMLRIAIPSS